MADLFSKEQLKELQEISQLKGDEQSKKFNEFLKKCSPEQVEYLRKQYGGSECPFCLIKEGKLKSEILYQDENVMVIFDINPASKGHMLVIPLNHESSITNSKDYGKIMDVVQRVAKVVFDVLKVEGVNILIGDGVTAGQKVAHGYVHVIPRSEDDKVKINWEKLNVKEKDLQELSKLIKEKLKVVKKLEVKPVKVIKELEEFKFKERIP
ncbi:HIT domain-containing protein [Candidatus Woesearchaeota archaeon]|nr:HIT domain-containing protein [Candidatus Woesearchaeota archaeon]